MCCWWYASCRTRWSSALLSIHFVIGFATFTFFFSFISIFVILKMKKINRLFVVCLSFESLTSALSISVRPWNGRLTPEMKIFRWIILNWKAKYLSQDNVVALVREFLRISIDLNLLELWIEDENKDTLLMRRKMRILPGCNGRNHKGLTLDVSIVGHRWADIDLTLFFVWKKSKSLKLKTIIYFCSNQSKDIYWPLH